MIFCVWTGDKYGPEYVERLRNMVLKHSNETQIACITDNFNAPYIENVHFVYLTGLQGWWAKMFLFMPEITRHEKCVYFDLDTIILDSIQPLLDYDGDFAICQTLHALPGIRLGLVVTGLV